jgi:NarL family two-component system response regulator LiaR
VNHPIKVLVVDDDEVFRQRIRKVLESAESITIAGQAQNSHEAMALARELHPDVVLVDIGTSPKENLHIVAQISKWFPDVRIVVLNEGKQEQQVLDAFRRGALGHLSRERAQSVELVHAIRAAARGEAILSPDIAGHILDEVARERKNEP